MTTRLLTLPEEIAAALSSDICDMEPYQTRQPILGARKFIGSLEFIDGGVDTSAARRKLAIYTATAYITPSPSDNVLAEKLLVQLCHGELSWLYRIRASNIEGIRPITNGLTIVRTKDDNNRISISVSVDIVVEIAAYAV